MERGEQGVLMPAAVYDSLELFAHRLEELDLLKHATHNDVTALRLLDG